MPKPKAKAKSKPRAKKQIEIKEEPIQEEPKQEEPKQEEPKEETKNDKVKKVVELVKCPKCDKMMSQKSLRYTHEQNCKGTVVKTEDQPVKRRVKKEPTTSDQTIKQDNDKKEIYSKIVGNNISNKTDIEIPEELKQEVIKTIQRTQARMKLKEDNFNKLKMQIA